MEVGLMAFIIRECPWAMDWKPFWSYGVENMPILQTLRRCLVRSAGFRFGYKRIIFEGNFSDICNMATKHGNIYVPS